MTDPQKLPVQVRTIRAEAWRVSDDEIDVTGRLVDDRPAGGPHWWGEDQGATIHDMTLTIRVRHPDLVITRASGSMASHPYTLCPDALPPLQRLVGLSVARGFTRAVNERFGRQLGCAHMTALIQALGPVVRQAAGAAFRDEAAPPRPDRDLWFVNTCQAWRERGPLHARLAQGDLEGLKALSARTPRA
ncbi:MAG: DUF2889 domain-containing protein [candidate division NC10 bacterium]|nr:DUF2889 domain-containing protein [candidate division NC10 bacterium]